MVNLTIRRIDYRVFFRLLAAAARNRRSSSEEARDILTRAVGIEPKPSLPPPPRGFPTPWVPEGVEPSKPPTRSLTVSDIPKRVLQRLEAVATKNKRTKSAEARTIITEAVGYEPPLPKGEESAYEALTRVFAPLRKLNFTIPTREEIYGPDSR